MNEKTHTIPSATELAGVWKERVGAAKVMWAKLTDDELLRSKGELEQLAGLVQQRYAVSRAAADKQVADFLEGLKPLIKGNK